MPEERISWKESNLALIGSELDHKIKAAAAEGEPQWDGIDSGPGTKVWRIEQFKVVPWPEDKYGHFHKGDSYVVLNAYKKSDDSDALFYDLHIWIGKESSQDEYGTAAYKMVEADDALGGAAVQHRQVQDHEGSKFLGYFGGSVTYLDGGAATGFTHVEPTKDVPHLYKIKGRMNSGMTMTQEKLSKSSLNSGDSFILYANNASVWVWHGASSNPDEKARANRQGEKMCTEGTVVTLDQGQGDEEQAEFWAYLEGDGDIPEADEADEDVEEFVPLLFKVPAPGDDAEEPEQIAKAETVKQRFGPPESKFDRALLDESGVFLIDAGWEVFLWMGKESGRDSKFAGMAHADSYMKGDQRTVDLPLTIVKSGFENDDFSNFIASE